MSQIPNGIFIAFAFRWRDFLSAQGDQVVFVSPSGQYAAQLQEEGFRWVNWEVGRQTINPLKEVGAVINLLRIIKKEAPDLVHLHTIKPVLYGSLCAWLRKKIAIVRSITGRGYVFLGEDARARMLRPFVKMIYRFALNSGRGVVIFENETDRDYFVKQKLVNPDKTRIIEGVGVDTEYYSPTPEPDGTPIVVLAGRMLWDKGVGTFVEAARLLSSRVSAAICSGRTT